MPLKHILKNKLLLQENFKTQEISMDIWPFWLFEENIKLSNEIIEEKNNENKAQENAQMDSMPDTSSMMKDAKNMTSGFNIPKL